MKAVKGIVTVFAAIVYYLAYQLFLPTLSIMHIDGFIFISVGVLLAALLLGWWMTNDYDGDFVWWPLAAVAVIFVLALIVGGIASSALVNANKLYNQLGKPKEMSFIDDVLEIDTSQIPIVDLNLAAKLADKKMGEDVALGSQVKVGSFTNKQQINGKLYYVAPLEHRGFWKWKNNRCTTGYLMVSATNLNDVRLVRETPDGEPIRLQYLDSAYFGSDLERHIRNKGYRTQGLTEYSFELDDEYKPHWVITTYENTTFWSNPEATGVVVCDPYTGDCEWYSVQDAPDWVDIIQPEDFVVNQIKNYGAFVHGFRNYVFAETDVLSMTEHMTTVYNDGECYYYTGMSSAGEDDGTVGFILVSSRDKSSKFYKMVGVTEAGAMRSMEGEVQDMGYKALTPIPINVMGIPTYFSPLQDNEGLNKRYAMLQIDGYSTIRTGTTIEETMRAYVNAVNRGSSSVDFSGETYGYSVTGTVTRIGYNIEGGDTYYYMILDDDASKLYLASYMVSEELPITSVGDTVEVSYVDDANGTINIVSFDNIAFAQTLSPAQEKLNEENKAGNIINNPDNKVIEVDPDANEEAWENLTDEEKAKLLKELQNENDK